MVDSTQPSSPVLHTSEKTKDVKLAATQSVHGDFLEKASPQWLIDATPERKQALKDASTQLPAWFQNATAEQRNRVTSSFLASFTAQTQLDKTMSTFQDVETFARSLLLKVLKDVHQVEVDVDKTLLCLRRPLELGVLEIEVSSFEVLKLSMLDAALHNFEEYECEEGAYHKTSGFVEATSTSGTYHSVAVNLKVSQFLTLCRSLDIGAKYQAYLQSFFYPEAAASHVTLREHFIASQKAALKAAAEQALLTGDIEPADHQMILSVIDGVIHPWMGDKQVWFRTLGLMKLRMTGTMVFVISEKYRYTDELIVYIPQDPEHPLKRYRWSQMEAEFKRLFTAPDASRPGDATPTPYQVFFSRFVPFDKRAYYFSQFSDEAGGSTTDFWRSPWGRFINDVNPLTSVAVGIKELPPEAPPKRVPKDDPYLAPSALLRRGKGIWAENIDPWNYLYEQHRERVIADARAHAMPTADVDARAREAKLGFLLEIGLLGLNVVSMFVPVLGEVMMVVMAGQLLYETLEGSIEWAEGDRRAAKAHLVDVAQNLALIGVMAGVGAGVSKWRAAKAEPVIEALSEVTRPDGQERLWRPSLSRYESPVIVGSELSPNTLGQYVKDGKTYIRQGNKVYEQYFDESLNKWRIKHPTDAQAYQPILEHNGRGAWQHTLERPLEWDRLTLLRRMGHETEAFTDPELLKIADVSGVSDNALRKMHVDHTVAPPELLDSLRLFKADANATRVIEQLEGTRPIDDLYLYALPLIVEMPKWPQGRVLEVFEDIALSGKSVKYGVQRPVKGAVIKPPIQLSRHDVLGGEVPARILLSLDESEITQLLGAQAARFFDARKLEFNQQLAGYARQRKPAIFDSIYTGTEPVDSRVLLLQRACPGLSESAALGVLEHAGGGELERLATTQRVPLNMLEEARWYARQGRLARAYAGLRSEVMASADSRRLALHTLQVLPGWPDTLRLEVRDGSISGALLDSIGAETASEKKYLVKQGPSYQAFNERGEELNSVPTEGDNYYASLMHAMPDDARRSLGVPQVSQHTQLQQKVIEQADAHRADAPGWLDKPARSFKPPVRVNELLLGYYASGRGRSVPPVLAGIVRTVYPDLTEAQVGEFLLGHYRAGKSPQEISSLLKELLKERTRLHSTIDHWVNRSAVTHRQYNFLAGEALKRSWRRSPLVGTEAGADALALTLFEALPLLPANFSHVRELSVSGPALHDGNIDGFLRHFPTTEKLSIHSSPHPVTAPAVPLSLANVPEALSEMSGLKQLSITLNARRPAAELPSRLAALTRLEQLELGYFGHQGELLDTLDLTPLQQLKKLKIVAPHVSMKWPAYAQKLARLERLDLSKTSIYELPVELYTGHERLWAGLSLDWSKFSYEAFKPAYEHVKNYSGPFGPHLANLDEMVRGYSRGELDLLMGGGGSGTLMTDAVMRKWNTPQTRMGAVELLRLEHAGIFKQFYQPSAIPGFRNRFVVDRWRTAQNTSILRALEKSWRGAVSQRYGIATDVSEFELPDLGPSLFEPFGDEKIRELPVLPAGTFSHVKTLKLGWLEGVPADQVRGFIQAFDGVQTLELRDNRLTEVPIAAGGLPELTRLDLSNNQIVVTPAVQAQFNGLKKLQVLDLQFNLLGTLDVSAMTQLTALNLRQTKLQAWPTGAEGLTQLSCLDLRDNQLTTLTPAALAHPDTLMYTELTGNPFSPEGAAALEAARRRVEAVKGLPDGALTRFALEPVPPIFPQTETAASISTHLLPLLEDAAGLEGTAGYAARLQRLDATLTEEQAAHRVGQLRDTGMDDGQIDTQLSQWHQDDEALTRQLNGWLFIREVRTSAGVISAQSRGPAAGFIRSSWQQGVPAGRTGAVIEELSLQGLQTGDLPELVVPFPHVHSLNLTGVKLSAQGSNGFLSGFAQLRRLVLSGNELAALPDAVQHLGHLERLELAANTFTDASSLVDRVDGERLRGLDLSHNNLEAFDTQAFSGLQTLDLSYNRISHWPAGALDAQHLTTLNLSGNELTRFPDELLDGNHDSLVSGTDLSDNHELLPENLRQMRDYADARERTEVMGFSRAELDRRLRRLESDSDSSSDSGSDGDSDSDSDSDGDDSDGHAAVLPAEVLLDPQLNVAPSSLEPWLANASPQLVKHRTELWNQLAQAQDHDRFFLLISRLRLTTEFSLGRASLTQRVWDVIEAAAENTELRATLFIEAETHGTCIDGRILTFSEMEVRVFEYRALRGIPSQSIDLRGRALLDLSRQLFRLNRVDQLAEAAGVGLDRAEERLKYRIGLTHGWPDGLALPGQPVHMAYGRPIEGARQIRARAQIMAAESTDEFVEHLISRDYWVRYLEERYPEQFDALANELAQKYEALEDEHSERGDTESMERYSQALTRMEVERATARNLKLMALSRSEIQRLAGIAPADPASPQPGPSWRP
ncbi:NEL-type E3 ubiquitin ligase domain-containing protein [Pseudomonas sp. AM4(2022)]|uniref:NEL-type E3 ubiquitin ligase domain-containing protein n=1 Tax=Pseudomonas sp. AM4(2022) TaxID=2983408 RepID=UPI002E822AB0|nr:NEL-type E3 ubiquitin ligase domain-containing protein [Pseudomonas sp. AM4(2022)]